MLGIAHIYRACICLLRVKPLKSSYKKMVWGMFYASGLWHTVAHSQFSKFINI